MQRITLDQLVPLMSQPKEYDRYWTCLCPFHADSNPSMLVYKDGFIICHSCGTSGNFYTLWKQLSSGVAIRPKVQREANAWHPPVLSTKKDEQENFLSEAHHVLLKYPRFNWYLQTRGVEDRVEALQLGWWDGWYTIPIRDEFKQLQGYVMRAGQHIQEATGRRFHMPPGPPLVYVPDWRLVRNSRTLFVVFGMMDAIVLNKLRMPVVTGNSGMRWFDYKWLNQFRHQIVFVPDRGEEAVARKFANVLGWRGRIHKLDYPPGCKDPADYAKASIGKLDLLQAELTQYMTHVDYTGYEVRNETRTRGIHNDEEANLAKMG